MHSCLTPTPEPLTTTLHSLTRVHGQQHDSVTLDSYWKLIITSAVGPWVAYLTSLSLSLLVYKMGRITSQDKMRCWLLVHVDFLPAMII